MVFERVQAVFNPFFDAYDRRRLR